MAKDTPQAGRKTGATDMSQGNSRTPSSSSERADQARNAAEIQERSEALKDAPGGFGTALEKMKGDKATPHKGSK